MCNFLAEVYELKFCFLGKYMVSVNDFVRTGNKYICIFPSGDKVMCGNGVSF